MKKNKKVYIVDEKLHLIDEEKELVIKNDNYFRFGKIQNINELAPVIKKAMIEKEIRIKLIGEEIDVIINTTYSEVEKALFQSLLEMLEFTKCQFIYEESLIPADFKFIIKCDDTNTIITNRTNNFQTKIFHDIFSEKSKLSEIDILIDYIKSNLNKEPIYIYGANTRIAEIAKLLEKKSGSKVYYTPKFNIYAE